MKVEKSLEQLSQLSARIGNDRSLIQGPGGNTSIKLNGLLWIKGSGSWLSEANEKQIFVPLDLEKLKRNIRQREIDPVAGTICSSLNFHNLRPSIETTLHSILPQKVVIHTHSVAAIAIAVQKKPEKTLELCLSGLKWGYIPYVRPGIELTNAVASLTKRKEVDVLILGNHGLVTGADDVQKAEALQRQVEERLSQKISKQFEFDFPALNSFCSGTNFEPVNEAELHAIAVDPVKLRMATNGSLYPDHVVFLGPRLSIANSPESLMKTNRPIMAVPGKGMLVRQNPSKVIMAMLRCLSDVLYAVDTRQPLNYLSEKEEEGLLNWDQEKFRKKQNR